VSGGSVRLHPDASTEDLRAAIRQAADGDTLMVQGGVFQGPLELDRAIHLEGKQWPVLDGGNQGTVLQITAEGARLSGFIVRGSGASLDRENSGISVTAPGTVIDGNRIEETLFGIYLRQASRSILRGNRIQGKDLPVARRGDPIRIWYSNEVRVEANRIRRGRDVVLWYSRDLHIADNLVQDGRYGLHFMYCDDAQIVGNRLTGNSVGAFLMYSRRLHMRRNTVAQNRGPSGYGIGLKDMDDAVIEDTLFVGNRVGAYVDNSPRELNGTTRFEGCVFAFNDVGVQLLPLVKRNGYLHNSFISNLEQVAVTGGGTLSGNRWNSSHRGGNYWSDYAGYDADRDGQGDVPYRADRMFEQLADRNPPMRLFRGSPAAMAMDFAAQAFPIFQPKPKLVDSHPLMQPVVPDGLPVLDHASTTGMALASAILAMLGVAVLRLGARLDSDTNPEPGRLSPGEPSRSHTRYFKTEPSVPMVAIRGVGMRFGRIAALEDVSFEIPAGQAVALWGPNGAGKTTLLRCLLGLLPYQGDVVVDSHHTRRQGKQARACIGFVPQELHFPDTMTVRETIGFYAQLKGVSIAEGAQRVGDLHLSAQGTKLVGELSGGMKQRLALAVALLGNPPLLLLDEPTANLDLKTRDRFLHLLQELKKVGKTLVFCSHHLDEVASACDRIVVLEEGRVRADCPPDQLDQHLGWEGKLWLAVDAADRERALTTLLERGFAAQSNHRGLVVPVPAGAKAAPIQALSSAGIRVADFAFAMESTQDSNR
jgi:nitrous oxidase accessory protein